MHIELSLHMFRRALFVATGAIAGMGLATEICDHLLAPPWAPVLVPLLSLSYEHNLPTWYVVILHATCACLLVLHGLSLRSSSRNDATPGGAGPGSAGPARWLVLGGLFAFISMDELIQIHESASEWFDTGGVFYFGWVIPAGVLVAALGLWYLPFLRALPARTRRRFILAGVTFVSGALLMELPLGYWTERAGTDNLVYAGIDWIEETLELVGVSLFLLALLDIPGRAPDRLRIAIGAP
ncbi:MAG TPA: hypothetical protein VNM90_13660 [Haliangium sp.]|nr:hypothetical protein [Haliangium sp.]